MTCEDSARTFKISFPPPKTPYYASTQEKTNSPPVTPSARPKTVVVPVVPVVRGGGWRVAIVAASLTLLHPVRAFPLDLVHKVVVTLVEVVNADVAVFSAACVALAGGVGGDGVEGTEVAADTADLVLEDLVVEAGLEFTLTGGGSGDVHSGLAAAEDDKVLLRGDASAVEGRVGWVVFQDPYLRGLVLARGDEVGAVSGPLEVKDGHVEFVNGHVVQHVAGLGVVLGHAAVLMARENVLAQSAPARDGGLALVAHNGEDLLVALLGVDIGVAHALLGDAQQLGAVLVELDALDGGGELPDLEAAARLNLPEADSVVGGARGDHGARGVDVHGPDGTDVAVVGAEALAVVGEPGADVLVLCDGENNVAIEVYRIWVSARSCPARRMGLMMGGFAALSRSLDQGSL
ncbi:hypothetical protein TOPH_06453 [Tolypocladium ophioglossoides CBS 100239]|uniref:Uncharacterized protein n=1 Tax=Tolypocladium ophioglossoides (strain CBS 100239) TaxID=1163406 RepID=A0A0L0N530_TOLOC|nr:hypothetical protein TOPH_06453 [Tolypocladium ophioglossoides CBS 100239]